MGCCTYEVTRASLEHPVSTKMNLVRLVASSPVNLAYEHLFQILIDKEFANAGTFKETPCYCWLGSKAELFKKRDQFWETRVTGSKEIWALLRMVCETDDLTEGRTLLEAAQITLTSGYIVKCYDVSGEKYEIPVFCVSMPYEYSCPPPASPSAPVEEKPLTFTVRSVLFQKDTELKMNSLDSVLKAKQEYLARVGKKEVRLFSWGRELQDNQLLGECKVQGIVVQAYLS